MPQLSKNTVQDPSTLNVSERFKSISNPYSSLPRQRTFWDKLLNFFGMRSGYDKAQEEYNLAGAEYNSQLEQLSSEEQYNSPVEQANRMRQAGMNPDLLGTGDVSQASEFDNQQESPDVSAESDVVEKFTSIRKAYGGFVSNVLGSLGTVSTILDNLSAVGLKLNDLRKGSYDRATQVVDLVEKLTGSLLDYDDPNMSVDQFVDDHSDIIKSLIPNPWHRKVVLDYMKDYYGSVQNVFNQKSAEGKMEQARLDLNTLRGDVRYSRRDDDMQDIIRYASKLNYDFINEYNRLYSLYYKGLSPSLKAGAENSQNRFTQEFNQALNPNDLAGAENAEAGSRSAIAEFNKEVIRMQHNVSSAYTNFNNFIGKKARNGSIPAMLYSFAFGRNLLGVSDWQPLDGEKRFMKNSLPFALGAFNPAAGAAAAGASMMQEPWMPFGATNGVW